MARDGARFKRPKLGGIIKSDLLITRFSRVFFLIFVLDEDKMVTDSLCSGRFSLPEYSYTDAFFVLGSDEFMSSVFICYLHIVVCV